MNQSQPEILFDALTIQERTKELARKISEDHQGADPLVLVGVLRGSFMFLADLARLLTAPTIVDFIHTERYGDKGTVGGDIKLLLDLRTKIENRHALIVEDIVDHGTTLRWVYDLLMERKPTSLKVCSLLRKAVQTVEPPPVDYLGFDCPDDWVVGYGLDYAGHWRSLPYVGILDQSQIQEKNNYSS